MMLKPEYQGYGITWTLQFQGFLGHPGNAHGLLELYA